MPPAEAASSNGAPRAERDPGSRRLAGPTDRCGPHAECGIWPTDTISCPLVDTASAAIAVAWLAIVTGSASLSLIQRRNWPAPEPVTTWLPSRSETVLAPGMVTERLNVLASLRVPKADGAIVAGRRQPLAVRGERRRDHRPGMSAQPAFDGAGRQVDQPRERITAGDGPRAVRRHGGVWTTLPSLSIRFHSRPVSRSQMTTA